MNTHTNENNPSGAAVKPITAARKPAAKVQGKGHFGVKALIISLSIMGTMGGWGALAVNHIRDTQAKQILDAQDAMLALNDVNAGYSDNGVNAVNVVDATLSAPVSNVTNVLTVANKASAVPAVRIAQKTQTAAKPTVTRTAPQTAQSKPTAPVLVARIDAPAKVVSTAPVLRDVQAQPRPVRRTRSSR